MVLLGKSFVFCSVDHLFKKKKKMVFPVYFKDVVGIKQSNIVFKITFMAKWSAQM